MMKYIFTPQLHILLVAILFAILGFLCLIFFVTVGNAHHPEIIQTADCSGYRIQAEYFGGGDTKKVEWNVNLTVNGVVTNIIGSWDGISQGFVLFDQSGPETDVLSTGYVRQYSQGRSGWVIEQEELFDLSFVGPCVTPSPTVTPTGTVGPTLTTTQTPTLTSTPTPTASVTMTPGPTSTPQPGPTQTPSPPEPQSTPRGLEPGVQYGWK